jgi:hypothetical protein
MQRWFEDSWPFERVALPGKDIAWAEWEAIEEAG